MRLNNLTLAMTVLIGTSMLSVAMAETTVPAESAAAMDVNPDAVVVQTAPPVSPVSPTSTDSVAVSTTETAKNTVDNVPVAPVRQNPAIAGGAPMFTPEQEQRIGELVKTYLLKHPDILVEVSQSLEVQQQAQQIKNMSEAVLRHQDALLDDKSTPAYGPDDAKVAFIEFFDYQCAVCARQAPVIKAIMRANPQVRYMFKEWPIFAQRWAPSLSAAETGLQIWQQKGADAYLSYHNAIYATGNNEGKLTQADISKASAMAAGKLKGKNDEMLEVLSRTDALAQNLGMRGTPGMIIIPVNGATAENITVIPGGADQAALQAAIDKAAGVTAE